MSDGTDECCAVAVAVIIDTFDSGVSTDDEIGSVVCTTTDEACAGVRHSVILGKALGSKVVVMCDGYALRCLPDSNGINVDRLNTDGDRSKGLVDLKPGDRTGVVGSATSADLLGYGRTVADDDRWITEPDEKVRVWSCRFKV